MKQYPFKHIEAFYTGGGVWSAIGSIDDIHYCGTDDCESLLIMYHHDAEIEEAYDEEYAMEYECEDWAKEYDALSEEEKLMHDTLRKAIEEEKERIRISNEHYRAKLNGN